MNGNQSNDVKVSFSAEGLEQQVHVLGFTGSEGISQLFVYQIDLACSSNSVDFDEVVGQPGTLVLERGDKKRYVNGVVANLEQRKKGTNFTHYHVTLVPRAWRLLHRKDCRIFQEKTAKDIVAEVLDDASVEHRFSCQQDPPEREFCVQYRESDWHFVSRLLEQEGFFYFFEHTEDEHTLVIGNHSQIHEEISGESTVQFHEPDTTSASEEHVFEFTYSQQVVPGKVTLDDFNYEKATLDLKADEEGDDDTELEVYDYPGLYTSPEDGSSLSQIRLEEYDVPRRGGAGESDCTRLIPGSIFTLSGHDRSDFNDKEYLLTQVDHVASRKEDLDEGPESERVTYSNSFQYILKETPFRPAQATRQPKVLGTQTATVVGPSGEEIHTDKYGRVKVQFHWDRLGQQDERSSCWVRVSQYWAGPGYGAVYTPRIGNEVVVDFLEGNPDRPLITGRVYNSSNMPPLDLPSNATQSTVKSASSPGGEGFNEIRFEDKAGSEELYTHAQKDQNEKVLNDHSTTVGGSQSRSISGSRSASVGSDDSVSVSANRSVTVQENSSLTINAGERKVDVTGGSYNLRVNDKDFDARAMGKVHLKANTEGVAIYGHAKGTKVHGYGEGVQVMGKGKGVSVTGYGGTGVSVKGRSGDVGVEIIGDGGTGVGILGKPKIVGKAVEDIYLEAKTITLRAGGSVIVMDPGGIKLNGTLIKLNCRS